jgi:hypothetical protein
LIRNKGSEFLQYFGSLQHAAKTIIALQQTVTAKDQMTPAERQHEIVL